MSKFFQVLSAIWIVFIIHTVAPQITIAQSYQDDFKQIRADEEPESLTRDNTYYSSNENELYLFYDIIKAHTGGLYIGVGTDPNYLFAGWGHPDAMILFDFDQNIADLHKLYGLFFTYAENREDFLSLWKKDARNRVYSLIKEHTAGKGQQWKMKITWRQARGLIERRLKYLVRSFTKRDIPIFVTDDAQYDYIATLCKEGKIYSIRGDLTKSKTMQDIAKFAIKHNLPVTIAYFSNAEYYFTYRTGHFAKNIEALPTNDKSLILNTIARTNRDYYYIYTPTPIYNSWVNSRKIRNLYRLQKYVAQPANGQENLFTVSFNPPEKIKYIRRRIQPPIQKREPNNKTKPTSSAESVTEEHVNVHKAVEKKTPSENNPNNSAT